MPTPLLDQADLKRVLKFLQLIYAETNPQSWVDTVLKQLRALVDADHFSYNIWPGTSQGILAQNSRPLPGYERLFPAFEACFSEHPFLEIWESRASREAVRWSDVIPQRKFEQSRLYNVYYRPVGTRFQAGIPLDAARRSVTRALALNRTGKDFSDRDLAILELVKAHLLSSQENAMEFEAMRRALAAGQGAEVGARIGLVELTEGGMVDQLSLGAEELIHSYCGPWAAGCRLPNAMVDCLEDARLDLDTTTKAGFTLVREGQSGKLYVKPLPRQDHRLLLFMKESAGTDAERQSQSIGLTRREMEVLRWLGQGKANNDIAWILGISIRTVHKHVEHLFTKLGVENRQSALRVALSWRWPDPRNP